MEKYRFQKKSILGLLALAGILGAGTMSIRTVDAVHPLPTYYPFSSANKSICYQMTALNSVKLDGHLNQANTLRTIIDAARAHVDSNTDINISVDASCTGTSNQVSAWQLASYLHAMNTVYNVGQSSMYKIITFTTHPDHNFVTGASCVNFPGIPVTPNPRYVANHEFGHFAGLRHPTSEWGVSDTHTMMKAECNPGYAQIRPDDISQINTFY